MHGYQQPQANDNLPALLQKLLIQLPQNEGVETVHHLQHETHQPPIYHPEGAVEVLREVELQISRELELEVALPLRLVHIRNVPHQKFIEQVHEIAIRLIFWHILATSCTRLEGVLSRGGVVVLGKVLFLRTLKDRDIRLENKQ